MNGSRDHEQCPVCESQAPASIEAQDILQLECRRCGNYGVTLEARRALRAALDDPRAQANASGWIREHPGIVIGTTEIAYLAGLQTPSVAERADKLLAAFEKSFSTIGQTTTLQFERPEIQPWIAASWSIDAGELSYLTATYLHREAGFLAGVVHATGTQIKLLQHTYITPKGYAHLQELKFKGTDAAIGFCAMWFRNELTDLWMNAIEPAIRDAGYEPKRIDRIQHNNKIDDEIVATIRRSRFVIADFTGSRGGVYFEAGFALGLNIPVIWTTRTGRLHRVHFDTRQYNFIEWDGANLAVFKERLRNRIEATIGSGPIPRP